MTEYEAASLALQHAALAAQQASVWVAAVVGAAQCSLIGYGLYIMRRAAIHRDALHQESMTALRGQQEAQSHQHRETMKALDSRHREAMAALNGQSEALNSQSEALRELIRRTSVCATGQLNHAGAATSLPPPSCFPPHSARRHQRDGAFAHGLRRRRPGREPGPCAIPGHLGGKIPIPRPSFHQTRIPRQKTRHHPVLPHAQAH